MKLIKMFAEMHEAFFEHDKDNKMLMGVGFVASALAIFVVVGLYQL